MKIKKQIVILSASALLISGVSFFGGMQYQKGQALPGGNFQGMDNANAGFNRNAQNGQNVQSGQRGGMRQSGMAGGFISGNIIKQDASTITIGVNGGGSKIVFLADATKVSKTVDGAVSDLQSGTSVMVTGKANSDGSVTADSIQIRPAFQDPSKQN